MLFFPKKLLFKSVWSYELQNWSNIEIRKSKKKIKCTFHEWSQISNLSWYLKASKLDN